MPLWKAKGSRSEDGPIGGPVVVFSGSLRSPDEADALSVKLSIRETEITLTADGTELGRWPAGSVDIRRFDATAFEFIAEGDRLIFIPEDPAAFNDRPIVGDPGAGTDGRQSRTGRKSRKRSDETKPRLALDQDSPDEEQHPRRSAAQESPKDRPKKQSRRRRKTTAGTAAAEVARLEVVSDPPSTVPGPTGATSDDEQPVADAASSGSRRRRKSRREPALPDSDADDALPVEPKERLNRAWIRALDVARKYDTFGLDRVPIDVGLRGQEHQHTWDHRVAASSGLGKHICTICGAVRR